MRTSERGAWRRCQQLWWWRYHEGWVGKGVPKPALWFGTGIHLAMSHLYCGPGLKRGPDPVGVWRDYVGEEVVMIRTLQKSGALGAENIDTDEFVEAGELGESMLWSYLNKYGEDKTWDVIAPERSVQLEIPWPGHEDDLDYPPIVVYGFTFDLVYRDLSDGYLYLGEHKTAKAINTRHLPLDDQAGSYWAGATQYLRATGELGPKEQIRGIMYNYLRKGMPDERPKDDQGRSLNKNGSVSKIQPKPLFHRELVIRTPREQQTQILRIQQEAEAMEMARQGLIPIVKNTTKDCTWCDFYNMCLLHEQQSDWEEFRDATMTQTDLYEHHREPKVKSADDA